MEFIPIKTRILKPPQDDLWAVLDKSLREVREGDVILISSKVIAIHQGCCLLKKDNDIELLIKKQEDFHIPRPYWKSALSVVHNAFLGSAGIDESNGDGHYLLLPQDIFAFAKEAHTYLSRRFSLQRLGIIVTDSHSTPFRYGAIGVALGWWGIEPLADHRGRKDLFGRVIRYERSNIVDGLAAAATVLMGEVDECTPVVVARNVPRLEFTDKNTENKLFVPYQEDTFRVLYERFLP